MRHFIFLVAFLATLPCFSQTDMTILASTDDNVLLPGQVLSLVGRQRSTHFTWIVVEEDGVQYSRGKAKFQKRDETVSYFQIEGTDTTFALPNIRFGMKDQVVIDHRGKKLEALIIEPYEEDCTCDEESGGLAFRRDSVTKNTSPVYKMFLYTQDVEWMQMGSRLVPAVPSHVVDTLDNSEEFHYVLAVQTVDGVFCDLMELHRDFGPSLNKTVVYVPSMRDFGQHFVKESDGTHAYKGHGIESFLVMKEHRESGGTKQLKHKKRRRF